MERGGHHSTTDIQGSPVSTTRRRSTSHKSSEVVAADDLRPDWNRRILAAAQRQAGSRRASTSSSVVGGATFALGRRLAGNGGRHQGGGSGSGSGSGSRRSNSAAAAAEYNGYLTAMRHMGTDLEELMIIEAMRQSIQDEHDRQAREAASTAAAAVTTTTAAAATGTEEPSATTDTTTTTAAAAAAVVARGGERGVLGANVHTLAPVASPSTLSLASSASDHYSQERQTAEIPTSPPQESSGLSPVLQHATLHTSPTTTITTRSPTALGSNGLRLVSSDSQESMASSTTTTTTTTTSTTASTTTTTTASQPIRSPTRSTGSLDGNRGGGLLLSNARPRSFLSTNGQIAPESTSKQRATAGTNTGTGTSGMDGHTRVPV
ncbi:hypothetical protein BG004_005172 [Podila humilis]|nr:hypothetical protein BG004_005172 [Podila humilis]